MLHKNDQFEMTCDAFGQDAQGVCRHEGMAVFVPGLLPGERALVRIVKPEKRYAFGRVEKLLSASPDRAQPFCPSYRRCGGCSCQHMTYASSLAFKREQAQALLERVGGLSVEVPPVLGMEHPFAYRNKGVYPVACVQGKPVCGFFAPRSHDLIPLPDSGCRIQNANSHAAVRSVLEWMHAYDVPAYDEPTGRGLVRHVMTRSTTGGALMVTLVVTRAEIPAGDALVAGLRAAVPGLESVCLSINPLRTNVILGPQIRVLFGRAELEETLCGLRFSVSPLSFFQVNPTQTERLYRLALEFAQLTGNETVVDAYCGAGTISLLLARHAARVVGIEIVPQAIENARANALRNGIENAVFFTGATEKILPPLVRQGLRPDVVVIDPTRKGCDPAVLDAILRAQPTRVVYVSCALPTLARDAKILCAGGYRVSRVQCVDMFCWTGAVETVMLLVQQRPDDVVRVGIDTDELGVTKAESKATYGEIQARVKAQTGLNVTPLYIAQVKRKHGIIERECYNKAKADSPKMHLCPSDKEAAIEEALRFFGMIA